MRPNQTMLAALSQHQWVVAWNLAHIWQRDFMTVDGTQHYPVPVLHVLPGRDGLGQFLFPALTCLPGVLWLVRRRRWAAPALLKAVLWLFWRASHMRTPAPSCSAVAGAGSAGRPGVRRLCLGRALGARRVVIALIVCLAAGLAWGPPLTTARPVAYRTISSAFVVAGRAHMPGAGTR